MADTFRPVVDESIDATTQTASLRSIGPEADRGEYPQGLSHGRTLAVEVGCTWDIRTVLWSETIDYRQDQTYERMCVVGTREHAIVLQSTRTKVADDAHEISPEALWGLLWKPDAERVGKKP